MIDKYYEEELRYLYESGREFSKMHPDVASRLNIDAISDRDPYIERLFEGFAFLTARIREKIDDSFPELSEGLINLLWPQFQYEFPSLCIVEFKPRKGHIQNTQIIPKGSQLLTKPLGPDSVPCSFITTQDVNLNPMVLKSIDKSINHQGKGTLTFNFQLESGVKPENLMLTPLKLYIYAEVPTAMAIHELMTKHVEKAVIFHGSNKIGLSLSPLDAVTAAGFSENELLMPMSSNFLSGNEILLEYFCFPEKFLSINLFGLDQLSPLVTEFSISYSFDCAFPEGKIIKTENFRLGCTPAINIFKKITEPILCTGKRIEYQITADSHYSSTVTHSLISVTGANEKTGERFTYEPVHRVVGEKNKWTYSTRYKTGISGKREVFITTGNPQISENGFHEEILSIEAWCTNGNTPREEMGEGFLSIPGTDIPDFVSFTNITRPSVPVCPPEGKDYLWLLLSQLNAGYQSFSSAEILKTYLSLYNWSSSKSTEERINAICDVKIDTFNSIYEGAFLKGVRFSLSVLESKFFDNGDLHLFSEVLRAFFSNYVSVNSVVELVINAKPSGKQMHLSSLRGKKWPL